MGVILLLQVLSIYLIVGYQKTCHFSPVTLTVIFSQVDEGCISIPDP